MLIYKVLLATILFVGTARCQDMKNTIKIFMECAKDNGMDLKKFIETKRNTKGVSKLPEEFYCTSKCVWEKEGRIKNGKIDLERVKDDVMVFTMMKDREEFLKCIETVDSVKDCDDAKELLQCVEDNQHHYLEQCAEETKFDEDKFSDWLQNNYADAKKVESAAIPKEILCMGKCLLEKQGVLDKDGKINTEKAKTNSFLFLKTKDEENFSKCLDGVTISQCEDLKQIHECRISDD